MILPTGDWVSFGKDNYLRKFEVYNMEWPDEVNLDTFTLNSGSFGGPIAVVRDRKKIVKVQGVSKPIVSVYTASGVFISSFLWDSVTVVHMGWSYNWDLLFVREDGQVVVYDMFCEFQHKFSMGKLAEETKVVDARIFRKNEDRNSGTGVAVLTTANRIFLVNSIHLKLAKLVALPVVPGVNNSPTAWTVVSEERHSRVLYARGKDLFSLSETEREASPVSIDMGNESYSIVDLAVSWDYELLAAVSDRGKVWLGRVDTAEVYRLFDTRITQPPLQLLWCRKDAVVVNSGSQLDVIGRADENTQYTYYDSVFCVQECDCVRVVSFHTTEILQRVPSVSRDVFKINSTAPGSYLLEASKQFQRKSHKANEYLHLVKSKLFKGVQQCIEAAAQEFNPEIQKMLLKAAQFGKTYLDDRCPENYVDFIRILRCLNAVRHPKIGIPLTYEQLQTRTIQGLMELLMLMRNHFLALDFATYLKMPNSSAIQFHWACYKVKHSKQDAEIVARNIASKLADAKDISFSHIAEKAYDCMKHDLAVKLLEYEKRANLQIPLLLKLNQSEIALKKSIESGDTDLVYHVLDHIGKDMIVGEFFMKIRNYPLAKALFLKRCRLFDREKLKDAYSTEDARKNLADLAVEDSLDPTNSGMREALLTQATNNYKFAKLDVNAALCEEQTSLYKHQVSLENKFKRPFTGEPLQGTLKKLLFTGEFKLADRLRADYKVPDRRYWWLKIKVLGEKDNWMELEKLSKSKKSPIGYEPFVDACLQKNNLKEAEKYLPKVRDDLKVQYLTKCRMFREAAQLAFDQKDLQALKQIRGKCDGVDGDMVAGLISQLAAKSAPASSSRW